MHLVKGGWGWGCGGGGKAETREPSSESGLQHGGMYTTVARSSFDQAKKQNWSTVEQQPLQEGGAGKFYNAASDAAAPAETERDGWVGWGGFLGP